MFGSKQQNSSTPTAEPESLITEPNLAVDLNWKPVSAASISFVKVRDLHGSAPVGTTFSWTYKWTPEAQRLARARKAFEAASKLDPEYKGESLFDWDLVR
jgi:hypothetical protein